MQVYDDSSSDYMVSLRNSIELFHRITRDNAEASKREHTERYNSANCPRRWKSFTLGDRLEYKNYYLELLKAKVFDEISGSVQDCRLPGSKILDCGGRSRNRWILNNELLHSRDRKQPPAAFHREGNARSLVPQRRNTVISGSRLS